MITQVNAGQLFSKKRLSWKNFVLQFNGGYDKIVSA